MRVKELIEKLQNFNSDAFVYLNTECNIEDEFLVVRADTDNILLVSAHNFDLLASNQEFSFYIN